jgi:hypothetical protein
MLDTLARYLTGFTDISYQRAVRVPLEALIDRYSSQALTSAALAINGAGATFAKTTATPTWACAKGMLVAIPAGTAMPPPTGLVIPANGVGLFCCFTDSAGNLTTAIGTPGTSYATVGWPQFPKGNALIGIVVIFNPNGFTGGTTALDAAGGNVNYISPVGAFDPTALTGY